MFSVVIPTIGRDTLRRTLASIEPQLRGADEIIIVGDGPQPSAKALADGETIHYHETEPTQCWGNTQRNYGISKAKGDYLLFIDDDDVYAPNALDAIRGAAWQYPGLPLMFRMDISNVGWDHLPPVVWDIPIVRNGNVGTPMFVCPNTPGKVGRWRELYNADLFFMVDTLMHYPPNSLVWMEPIIAICRPNGIPNRNQRNNS